MRTLSGESASGVNRKPTSFPREATGLVREWSSVDGLLYSIYMVAPSVVMGLAFSYGPLLFPGGNMILALILGMVLNGFLYSAVYASLGSAMPRSGGDYVFISRIVHPLVGFTLGFTTYFFVDCFNNAIIGYLFAKAVLSPVLFFFGYLTGNKALVLSAVFFGTNIFGILTVQMTYIAWGTFVCVVGLRAYSRLMRWLFPVWLAGSIAIAGVFAIGRDAFVESFNKFTMGLCACLVTVQPNTYQGIINTAASLGWNPYTPFSWGATFGLLAITARVQTWPGILTLNFGEIKGASSLKRGMTMMIGSQIFLGLYLAIVAALLINAAGYPFLSSIGFLFFEYPDASPLPTPPYYPVLASMLTQSPIIVFLALFCGTFLLTLAWFPTGTFSSSRALLSMTFDRVLPEWLGAVNHKWHTPVRIIALKNMVNVILVFMFDFVATEAFLLGSTLIYEILWLTCAVAAVVFPYRMREIYKKSPISRFEIEGVPIISLLGLGMIGYTTYMIYLSLTIPALGVISSVQTIPILIGLCLISAMLYIFTRWHRTRQGMDLNMLFKQVPPE